MSSFQEILKEKGLKITTQRLQLLNSLHTRGHATIEEIHQDLKELNPNMSIATIYRSVNELIESGIVCEIKIPKQKQRYEILKEPHVHLVCQHCGKIEDAMIDTKEFIKKVESDYKCDVIDDVIVLNVICSACKIMN